MRVRAHTRNATQLGQRAKLPEGQNMKRYSLVLGGERGFMRTTIRSYERASIGIDSLILVDKPKPETLIPNVLFIIQEILFGTGWEALLLRGER